MAVINQVEGILSWEAAETRKGKQYLKVTVGDLYLYAWPNDIKPNEVTKYDGQNVKANYKDGKFKALVSIETCEVLKQSTIDNKQEHTQKPINEKPVPCYGHNPANSPQYLACKLGVDLIKDESIQVDKKLERFEAAYKVMLKKIEEGK